MTTQTLGEARIAGLCRALSLLLRAGLPVQDGLALLQEEDGEAPLPQMVRLADEGLPLYEILEQTGGFPAEVCGMVQAGERTGCLEEALEDLAVFYEERVRLRRQVRAAFLYPSLLLLIMLVVIVLLLTQVLPVFNAVYTDLGSGLSGVAGGLFALGRVLDRMLPALIALLVLGAAGAGACCVVPALRSRAAALWQRGIGRTRLAMQFAQARFAAALALGIRSGLPDEEAIRTAARTLEERPGMAQRCAACLAHLQQEGSLPRALEQSGLLPRAEARLLELGQRSGNEDTAIRQVADQLSQQAEDALEGLVARVEPTLVVVSSLLVGCILLSVMLPLLDIMAAIG